MAWETRDGRGLYYTRSRRKHGKVIREYVGMGHVGELAAAEDARRRAEREARKQQRLAEQSRWDATQSLFMDTWTVIELLSRASLSAAGYHLHERSEWRLRRNGTENKGIHHDPENEPACDEPAS